MHVGIRRELEKANEKLEQVQEEVTELKAILTRLLQEQEPQPVPEKQIKEIGQKNMSQEQKTVRL